MANRVQGSFDETTVAAVETAIDDLIDAAKEIISPTELEFSLHMVIESEESGNGVTKTSSLSVTGRAYDASNPHTVLKANLTAANALTDEFEDLVTASAKYNTITRVHGTITVTPTE